MAQPAAPDTRSGGPAAGTGAPPALISPRRLDFVDALRGAAALYVIVFHVALIPNPPLVVPQWAHTILMNGGTGVTLFFVLSAFTLCYTLDARRDEPQLKRRFYLRRILRIVPLYFCWLAFMIPWTYGTDWLGDQIPYRFVALCAGFLFNMVPGGQEGIVWASWTLGVEMLVYLAFPFLFFFVNTAGRAVLLLGISLVAAFLNSHLAQSLLAGPPESMWLRSSLLAQFPNFAVGFLAFFAYRQLESRAPLARRLGPPLLLGGVVLFVVVPFVLGPTVVLLYGMACAYAGIILGLAFVPARLLVNPVTVFLGTISYSLYLNHPLTVFYLTPAYRRIYDWDVSATGRLLACVVITLIPLVCLSYATYRVIERPGIRWGNRLIRKAGAPEPRQPGAIPAAG